MLYFLLQSGVGHIQPCAFRMSNRPCCAQGNCIPPNLLVMLTWQLDSIMKKVDECSIYGKAFQEYIDKTEKAPINSVFSLSELGHL